MSQFDWQHWLDVMNGVTLAISRSFRVDSLGNILAKDVPKDRTRIGFDKAADVTGVTKVAYCSNMLCFVLFTGDDSCVIIPQNTIRAPGGAEGYLRMRCRNSVRQDGEE